MVLSFSFFLLWILAPSVPHDSKALAIVCHPGPPSFLAHPRVGCVFKNPSERAVNEWT